MTTTLNASTAGAGGFIATSDNSGVLALQTGGTTAVTVDASQNTTFAGKVTSAGALTLASNGTTTALTINTSQYVGIGTTSPTSGLDIRPGITGNFNAITMGYGRSANPTDAVHKISWSSDSLNIEADTANTIASNIIFTNDNTERMRIDSSGNLLVGTTSTTIGGVTLFSNSFGLRGDYSASYASSISSASTTGTQYFFNFGRNTSQCGTISSSGSNSTTYATSSDYRLKENIQPMTGALEIVSQLKPVTYKWKEDGSDGHGFIAHELQAIVPECVVGEKDAVNADGNPVYQGIDTSFLVATLTAALQETKALIDTQAETINALTARIVALESRGTV